MLGGLLRHRVPYVGLFDQPTVLHRVTGGPGAGRAASRVFRTGDSPMSNNPPIPNDYAVNRSERTHSGDENGMP